MVTANFAGGEYPLRLSAISSPNPELFQMSLSGEPHRVYGVETSTNLKDWVMSISVTNVEGTTVLVDSNAPGAMRFYRAREE